MLEYVAETYQPDLLLVGMPTTDEFQHQFLGLVTKRLPERRSPTRPTTTSTWTACRDGRVAGARGLHPGGLRTSPTQTLQLARSLVGGNPTTFVGSDHGFAPQFLAVDASMPLVDLGLLSTAADLELPAGDR